MYKTIEKVLVNLKGKRDMESLHHVTSMTKNRETRNAMYASGIETCPKWLMLKAEGCFLKFQDNKEGKAQDTKGLNFLSESY